MNWTLPARSCLGGLSAELIEIARQLFEKHAWGDPNSGCWIWSLTLDKRGYGQISIGSTKDGTARVVKPHRLAWELYRGPLQNGVNIDHRVCRNKWCVNPWHLALCTKLENAEQPDGMIGIKRAKTHCPHGHPYSGDNLYVTSQGFRQCIACARMRYIKKKEKLYA